VRVYAAARGASPAARETLMRAAQREFQGLVDVTHPGILRALDYREHELGPAVVFLVERHGRTDVLKLALDPTHNARLQDEAEVLRQLRHQYIVEIAGTAQIGERVGLLMARAGDETLAQRLRTEGRLHVDLLQRFGEHLLQAVDWLEQKGIPHRDIKPDNIGIASAGRSDRLQLVLFDFSLSRVSPDRVRAGTRAYLDPFLSASRPWGPAAERFSAALTLYEMATGTLPRWGDGKSNPAVLDCEVTLDADMLEPSLREDLTEFFQRALRRDYRQRFDNAEEMLRAWQQDLEGWAAPRLAPVLAGLLPWLQQWHTRSTRRRRSGWATSTATSPARKPARSGARSPSSATGAPRRPRRAAVRAASADDTIDTMIDRLIALSTWRAPHGGD
jgi:serine/threonine protein kinase